LSWDSHCIATRSQVSVPVVIDQPKMIKVAVHITCILFFVHFLFSFLAVLSLFPFLCHIISLFHTSTKKYAEIYLNLKLLSAYDLKLQQNIEIVALCSIKKYPKI